MSQFPSSADTRRRVLDRVQQLLAEGRISLEQLDEELGDLELQLLQQSIPDAGYPDESYERLVRLVERVEGKPEPPEADQPKVEVDFEFEWVAPGEGTPAPPLRSATRRSQGPRLATHGTVSHEVRSLRLLMIGVGAERRIAICDQVNQSSDTRVLLASTEDIEDAADILANGRVDAALLECSTADVGLEQLAHPAVIGATVPVIPLISESQESQILHLGLREFLVVDHLTPRLMVQTLRAAVERVELMRALATAHERERFHATRDPMTGLPNRYHFRSELRKAIASGKHEKIAVLFLDLDKLKQINDTLGHDTGDALISSMASRIAGALRREDMVARVGGDEFLLMLADPEDDRAPAIVATKLLQAIAEPLDLGEDELRVTASVGIAVYPTDGTEPEPLIRSADAAMYEAKARGRDGYQFYGGAMTAVPQRRMLVESKLRQAVEHGDLAVHYQPRVDVERGCVVGAEALCRWHDPDLGSVSPAEFIPIAEESGLILPIGQWVLDTACEQLRNWSDAGHENLRMSVNLSGRQLRKADLRESIVHALWTSDIDPSRLEIEITETALIDRQEVATSVLGELRAMGIGVSLDDFGTGFSSLSYLKRFPVSVIKIDQSFVRDILVDADDAAIVDAILSIADKLRLGVVAEGVESIGQRDFLLARGCVEMQGFLFGEAVDGEAFASRISRLDLIPRGRRVGD